MVSNPVQQWKQAYWRVQQRSTIVRIYLLVLPVFEPRTPQPITSCYTDYAVPVPRFKPATPSTDRPQPLALDRSATRIGLDPRTAQPVASRYADWAIAAPP
jgi:hypothetical protein